MTQTLIEQLEEFTLQFPTYGKKWHTLRAIIEQHKQQPDIVSELVKALESFDPYDDFAALYQLKADIDIDALLTKAREAIK